MLREGNGAQLVYFIPYGKTLTYTTQVLSYARTIERTYDNAYNIDITRINANDVKWRFEGLRMIVVWFCLAVFKYMNCGLNNDMGWDELVSGKGQACCEFFF